MSDAAPLSKIPVTIITGFLGAGKTTLLRRILDETGSEGTAVIVNEFGEVGLDHALLEAGNETIVEMTSGCLCCTVQGDIRKTLLSLWGRQARGAIPPLKAAIVETTGLADPAPVIATLLSDPALMRVFTLGKVVTVIDAILGDLALDRNPESLKQAAVADIVVFTKTDLLHDPASRADLIQLRKRVASLNPAARQFDAADLSFDPAAIFAPVGFDLAGKHPDVRDWLNTEAVLAAERQRAMPRTDLGQDAGHGLDGRNGLSAHHEHHHHGVNRHGADIRASCLVWDHPLDALALGVALEAIAARWGHRLLRTKGIVATTDDPDHPLVVQGVQHIIYPTARLTGWPDEDRRSKLVFISRDVAKELIASIIDDFQSLSMPPPPQTAAHAT